MNIDLVIANEISVKESQVNSARTLLEEGNTLPFIARYRKERTGSLDETQLRTIQERLEYLKKLVSRKEEIVKSISEQGKLTDELKAKIDNTQIMKELEDLYLPYKKERKLELMLLLRKVFKILQISLSLVQVLMKNISIHLSLMKTNY